MHRRRRGWGRGQRQRWGQWREQGHRPRQRRRGRGCGHRQGDRAAAGARPDIRSARFDHRSGGGVPLRGGGGASGSPGVNARPTLVNHATITERDTRQLVSGGNRLSPGPPWSCDGLDVQLSEQAPTIAYESTYEAVRLDGTGASSCPCNGIQTTCNMNSSAWYMRYACSTWHHE